MTEHPTGCGTPPPVGACRVCDAPSWLADDAGAVHLCCRRWEDEQPGVPCPACAQRDENASAQRHRRQPALLPWPRLDTATDGSACVEVVTGPSGLCPTSAFPIDPPWLGACRALLDDHA